jgi:tellurite resistance protein TerA
MDNILTKGGNIPWPHPQATLEVAGLSAGGSVLAFLVTTTGKVRNDDDFVFFNNPDVPGVTIAGQIATIDLEKVAGEIDRIVIAAVQDDADPEPLSASPLQVTVDPTGLVVPVTGLSSERAVVLVEMYRRAQQWKIRSVSAGWTEGFSALVRAHGVEVDDDAGTAVPDSTATAAPVAEPPPTPSTLDLRKPGVDAIDLGKRTGTINLRKGQQVTITKTARIVATCTWPRATDYDIYALVSYRDGRCETVSTFGTAGNERDFQLATTDGAVRHSGDVGRTQSRGWRKKTAEVGQETIQITLNPEVRAVLPVVYSAQSNGTGSFRKYQVSMAIDNGSGDTVTIDAGNASDDGMVFSCVPGIIINDPDGVRIQFLELYSSAGSEQRPAIGADLIVQMDVGPVNAFK